jgi:tetratricopeptide (TPR) repeat protein
VPLLSRRIAYDRKRLIRRAGELESGWRWREALRLYRLVLAAEPHDPEIHARVAPLLARSRRHYEARESFRRAVHGFRRMGDAKRAEATLVAAAEALPDDPDAARTRAVYERAQNRHQEALRLLVETSDRLARRRRWRGAAIVLLREANQIEPRHPEVLLRLARLLHRDGQAAEALFWLDQLEGRVPGRKARTHARLRLRIDPTFRHLWAWLRTPRDVSVPKRLEPRLRGV